MSVSLVFETKRLLVYVATIEDTDMFFRLWTDPKVMGNVGFPKGLSITFEAIREQLDSQKDQVFDSRLVVRLKANGDPIGECKLGWPNEEGISATDVKLLPEYWGNKYGVEIKNGLLDYLFTHTHCKVVEATPNMNNIASIKMQEAVGGECIRETIFPAPKSKQVYQTTVHAYVYHVSREKWAAFKT